MLNFQLDLSATERVYDFDTFENLAEKPAESAGGANHGLGITSLAREVS